MTVVFDDLEGVTARIGEMSVERGIQFATSDLDLGQCAGRLFAACGRVVDGEGFHTLAGFDDFRGLWPFDLCENGRRG